MIAFSSRNAASRASVGLLLFQRFTWRHWRQSPVQSGLLVGILALGIGVYFAIRLANRAAVASFQNFTDLIATESDWVVSAPAGLLPEGALNEIRNHLEGRTVQLVPIVETTAAPPRNSDTTGLGETPTYSLVGIDLVAILNAPRGNQKGPGWLDQPQETDPGGDDSFWSILSDPRRVFISSALAAKKRLRPGSLLPLVILDKEVELIVAGVIPDVPGRPKPPETLLVMDLPALQRWVGKEGRLDRIECVVEPGFGQAEQREALGRELEFLSKGRWVIQSPADRRAAGELMTRAFRLNLTLLSMIALMVGLYLIFQALDAAVIRRREEIAVLRSLGLEARQIRHAWVVESFFLGLLGGAGGIVLGWLGAQLSVRLIGRTVNALYYATSADSAHLTPSESGGAFLLAILASLAAGWWPARQASRTPPAQLLVRHAEPTTRSGPVLRPVLGIFLLIVALLLAGLPALRIDSGLRIPVAGYAACLFSLLGTGMLSGGTLQWAARSVSRWSSKSVTVRLALGYLRRPSGRHEFATASLVWAVAMTGGMAVLVASFDHTMRGWIERTFQADLYISSAGAQNASSQNRIAPSSWRKLVQNTAVQDANILQVTPLRLPEGTTLLVGMDLDFVGRHDSFFWLSMPPAECFDSRLNEGMTLASESFLARFQKKKGDTVDIPTPNGTRRVKIVGTFADYGNERGSLTIDRHHFTTWFDDETATSIILYLKPGKPGEQLRSELLIENPGLQVFTNSHLRIELLRIFRQTFSVTYALELIGVVVAIAGLALALVSILLDRRSDLTTLRSIGMNRLGIALATALEGGILGAIGSGLGLSISMGLGAILVFVINRQTFGWTLQFSVPSGSLSLLGILVVAAATVTSFSVGRWGGDLPSDREE